MPSLIASQSAAVHFNRWPGPTIGGNFVSNTRFCCSKPLLTRFAPRSLRKSVITNFHSLASILILLGSSSEIFRLSVTMGALRKVKNKRRTRYVWHRGCPCTYFWLTHPQRLRSSRRGYQNSPSPPEVQGLEGCGGPAWSRQVLLHRVRQMV